MNYLRPLSILVWLVPQLICLAYAGSESNPLFDRVDVFLKKHVQDNRVNYDAIKRDPAELDQLVRMIADFDLETVSAGNGEKAFWINAYNILVINGIVENYPLTSPLDVSGFFKKIVKTAARKKLTLDDIENKMLRPVYKDARIHFVLVCAANGCPPIVARAYYPDDLEQQLDERTRGMLNHAQFIRVDKENKTVGVSQIFEWYAGDFVAEASSLTAYINRYRNLPLPEEFVVTYYPYDWSLNGQ